MVHRRTVPPRIEVAPVRSASAFQGLHRGREEAVEVGLSPAPTVDSIPAVYAYAETVHRPEAPFSYAYDMVYLPHLSVRPGRRRAGIGHTLLSALRSAARDLRIPLIGLDVWSFNEEARLFFRREGFTAYIERLWSGGG